MFIHLEVHVHEQVRSCTDTFMYRYVHVHCTGTFMYRYVHVQVHSCTGMFMYRDVHVQGCSCRGTFIVQYLNINSIEITLIIDFHYRTIAYFYLSIYRIIYFRTTYLRKISDLSISINEINLSNKRLSIRENSIECPSLLKSELKFSCWSLAKFFKISALPFITTEKQKHLINKRVVQQNFQFVYSFEWNCCKFH